jgi:predicted Fe-Mo cluster-binding NifX family protein
MKVAVSTDNGQVAAHFGRCPEYTIAEVSEGAVQKTEVIPNPGHQPGFLPRYLAEKGVEAIICGGAGPRARALFDEQGITVWLGVAGPVDGVLGQYAAGTLVAGDSTCDHGSRGDGSHDCRH